MRNHEGPHRLGHRQINNSDLIVTASRDKSIILWNLTKEDKEYGLPHRRVTGHSHFIQDVVLSSDGQFALSGSWDDELRLWDLASCTTARRFVDHTKDFLSIAFSLDNRQIVSASRDRSIKLWNTLAIEASIKIWDLESKIAVVGLRVNAKQEAEMNEGGAAQSSGVKNKLVQNLWLASELDDANTSTLKLLATYVAIGGGMTLTLVLRSYVVAVLGLKTSKAIFSKLMMSLFRAPMAFYDSTPLGRILSRVSSDLSIVDLELSFKLSLALASTMTIYFSYIILAVLTWPILIVIIPMAYVTILLQSYYFASSKELMRMDGTTKSSVASQISESIAEAM